MGLDSATVIGHSLGGAIALHLTLERPDLVERLGLVAPAGLGQRPPAWWHLLTGYGPIYSNVLKVPTPLTGPLIRAGHEEGSSACGCSTTGARSTGTSST